MNFKTDKASVWIVRAVSIFIGVVGGYFYWKYVGCDSGTCPITSKYQNTMVYGGLMGYLIGDSINDLLTKKSKR